MLKSHVLKEGLRLYKAGYRSRYGVKTYLDGRVYKLHKQVVTFSVGEELRIIKKVEEASVMVEADVYRVVRNLETGKYI